ncbi:MAG: SAM-dependent methyltransferase [Alphaproteobacteria bacterium]|nr:SAM-dependent methyltransferase [Alphaproteobacteria bacterium]
MTAHEGNSVTLASRIAALIEAQGPMSVAQFMSIALLDPAQGYYATRDPFGPRDKGGDFITAPEISQMFGEMLGLWLVQAWIDQGRPQNPRLVELGPGRGTLMADILRAARQAPGFLDQLEVVLIEASPVLRAVQQQTLADSGAAVRWQNQFGEGLDERPLFLVANEFFDALPLRQYVRTDRGWCERMVTVENDALAFGLAPVPAPRPAIPLSPETAPDGGVYETSPAALALAEDIAAIIARRGGAALLVDYGYQSRNGFGETLQALGGHRFADVLAAPGRDDLSAHVDFAALAGAGRQGGAAVLGPVSQGAFLTALGLDQRAGQLASANPSAAESLKAAVERLTAPAQMGTLFKALAFLPPAFDSAPGFMERPK